MRVNVLDTYEHVTDFESAADHTATLEKFQELHMPMSLPSKLHYGASITPRHQSPFELHVDNTESSPSLQQPGAKQFRHAGPWIAGQTENEFLVYLKEVTHKRPELLQNLREKLVVKRTAELRKQAQDNGEDLAMEAVTITDAEFDTYIRSLRNDPLALGPVIFELLDLASPPAVPSERVGRPYFQAPGTNLASSEYAVSGPPRTHPSGGLSYSRTHALINNHAQFGPQSYSRPVEARILRPKGKFKGKGSRALAGIGGIAVEDVNAMAASGNDPPPGFNFFDVTIPGGGKYWVSPTRASMDAHGRIIISSYRASPTARAPYGLQEHKKPSTMRISDVVESAAQTVPRMDRQSFGQPRFKPMGQRPIKRPAKGTEDIARNLLENLKA